MSDRSFARGAELSAAFYVEVVRPLLVGHSHSAGLLGWGSDVLGYDTERSTDHGWGPRLLIFLDEPDDVTAVRTQISARLPERFRGWPVRYGWDTTAVDHWVTVTTLPAWLVEFLGVDATAALSTLDWLLTPQQRLLGVVAGPVFADANGALGRVRHTLSWYPEHVWRWLLACQWHRLAQEEAFVGRAAEVGDEAGSAVIAARQVRDIMRLALLLERRYAPYSKWLGTAFAHGRHDDDLPDHLAAALHASSVGAREAALGAAYQALAIRHNDASLTPPLDSSLRDYFTRPARVLMADRFTDALLQTISDAPLRELPLIGSIDQVVDNTDVLSAPAQYRRLGTLYPGTSSMSSHAQADPT